MIKVRIFEGVKRNYIENRVPNKIDNVLKLNTLLR